MASPEPDTALFDRTEKADTSCNPPIAFVPVWYTNYAETFIGTVVPLVELEDRKVLNYSTTTVIADVLHKHLPRGVCRSGITRRCTMTSWFRGFVSLATGPFIDTAWPCQPRRGPSAPFYRLSRGWFRQRLFFHAFTGRGQRQVLLAIAAAVLIARRLICTSQAADAKVSTTSLRHNARVCGASSGDIA